MINIIDVDGNILPPIMREGKVRKLLKQHKAKVVNYNPFTIQLNYSILERTFNMTNIKEFIDMNKYKVRKLDSEDNGLHSYENLYFRLYKKFNEPGEDENNTPSYYYDNEHFFYNPLNSYLVMFDDLLYSITPSKDKIDTLALLQVLEDVRKGNAKLYVNLNDIVISPECRDIPSSKNYIMADTITTYVVTEDFIDKLENCLKTSLTYNRIGWYGYNMQISSMCEPNTSTALNKDFIYTKSDYNENILDNCIRDITNYHNALTHIYGKLDKLHINVKAEAISSSIYNKD